MNDKKDIRSSFYEGKVYFSFAKVEKLKATLIINGLRETKTTSSKIFGILMASRDQSSRVV